MLRLTASEIPRQLACPGSGHLPRAIDIPDRYAMEGSEGHADAEADADLGQIDELHPAVQALLWPGSVLSSECSFMYDVATDTARELGHITGRNYPERGLFEIPGTVDLVIASDGRATVVDYKLYLDGSPEQIDTYALMVARTYGLTEVTVALVYRGATWKPAQVRVLSAMDLDAHAERLRAMVTSGDRSLVPSKHCKHCRAFVGRGSDGMPECPAQRALALEDSSGQLSVRVEALIPFADDRDAALGLELAGRLRLLANRITAAVNARAAERPFRTLSGKMYGEHETRGNERLDGDVVYRVVRDQHGQSLADQAVERKATKAALERALKGKRGAAKAVLDEVRKQGGATRSQGTKIGEFELAAVLPEGDEE